MCSCGIVLNISMQWLNQIFLIMIVQKHLKTAQCTTKKTSTRSNNYYFFLYQSTILMHTLIILHTARVVDFSVPGRPKKKAVGQVDIHLIVHELL